MNTETNNTGEEPLVLIADDDPTHQLLVRGILTKSGYRVQAAPNGKVAVDMFTQERPDAVLMDCQMPELDGYQATQAIRQLESEGNARPVSIIAITGNTGAGEREKCIAAGMSDFLGKPFTIKQLQAALVDNMEPRDSAPAGQDSSVPDTGTPSVDASVLDGLVKLQQSWGKDLVKSLVQAYLQNSNELVTNLQIPIDSENLESVGEDADALASSSAKVGAPKLADLCKQLARVMDQGDTASAPKLQGQIRREYEQVVKALEPRLSAVAE